MIHSDPFDDFGHIAGITLICDSCKQEILPGTYHRKVRAPGQKPKTRKQAINAQHLRIKYNARHTNCPEPALQVACPKCFALPGDSCIQILGIGVNTKAIKVKPHKARLRERRIKYNE